MDGIILYTSQYAAIRRLSIEQKGRLLDCIFLKALGEPIDISDDPVLAMAFAFVEERMDSNAAKYEQIVEKRREAGRKGAIKTNQKRWGDNQQMSAKSANADNCRQNRQKSANSNSNFVEHTSQHTTLHTTNGIVNQQVADVSTPPYTPPYTPDSLPVEEKRKKKEEKREEEISPLTIPFIEEPKKEEINKEEKKDSGELTNVSSLSTTSVDAAADVDWKKFLDFFNATVNGSQIPKIRTITEERKKFIRARVKEFGKNALATAVKKAAASDFLNGCGNKAFVASFDWIFRPTNFPKVLEGNYDNKNLDYANRRDNGKTQRDIDRERRDREAAEIMSRLAEGLY